MKQLPVISHQGAERRLAKRVRVLEHRLKHRLKVAGRGVDDLQYLRGRGLPLQRLITLGSALGKLTFQIG
jgi:hypothetical protein